MVQVVQVQKRERDSSVLTVLASFCCHLLVTVSTANAVMRVDDSHESPLSFSVAAVTQLRTLSMHDLSLAVLKVLPERT